MKKVAIAYKTKTGTTKEAADTIKRVLETADFEVDVLSLEQNLDISNYQAVIVGAPINGFKWVPEATAFVEKNASLLKTVPTALYAMNYIGVMGRPSIKNTLIKSFAGVKALVNPVDVVLFGGKIDKELPGFARFLFGIKKGSRLDLVDPITIEAWAEQLKQKI